MAAARSFCSKAAGFSLKSSRAHDVAKPVFASARSMTTESVSSVKTLPAAPPAPVPFAIRRDPTVLATLHSFPTMEPVRFEQFPTTFLFAPLRRDLLHKAVVFEGDAHRFGRGKAKWRSEVHGSNRKIRPQKGTGMARLGNKKSPMLRGGGAAHGPKPRDFSTGLPRKMYDMAWRIALSFRYRRSELIVVDGSLELQEADAGLASTIIKKHGWGADKARSLFITADVRPNFEVAMEELGAEGRALVWNEVDVKDLLETGRVIIEKEALKLFEKEHGLDQQ